MLSSCPKFGTVNNDTTAATSESTSEPIKISDLGFVVAAACQAWALGAASVSGSLPLSKTQDFANWRAGVKDLRAVTAIRRRLERAAAGNLGDVKAVGEGVSEMPIDLGAGYRLYFTVRERVVLFLLVGSSPLRPQIFARPLPWPRRFET